MDGKVRDHRIKASSIRYKRSVLQNVGSMAVIADVPRSRLCNCIIEHFTIKHHSDFADIILEWKKEGLI